MPTHNPAKDAIREGEPPCRVDATHVTLEPLPSSQTWWDYIYEAACLRDSGRRVLPAAHVCGRGGAQFDSAGQQ